MRPCEALLVVAAEIGDGQVEDAASVGDGCPRKKECWRSAFIGVSARKAMLRGEGAREKASELTLVRRGKIALIGVIIVSIGVDTSEILLDRGQSAPRTLAIPADDVADTPPFLEAPPLD